MARRTALYDWHVAAGARTIAFGGWEMPQQYRGILEEHRAVRRAVGLFDVSHMGKLFVRGGPARGFLDSLSANAIPSAAGRARYTHLLREDGTILDDVIVTCLSSERFLVVCNAGPRDRVVEWLEDRRTPGVGIEDRTEDVLCIAVQGPRAPELLRRSLAADIASLRPFDATLAPLAGPGPAAPRGRRVPAEAEGWGAPPRSEDGGEPTVSRGAPFLVTRTGYTGEPGFELFPPAAQGRRVWEALLERGRDLGAVPVGLGARDTLRLEKGFLLSGQDFDGRQTPLEVGCEWLVKWDRPFLGREALLEQRARGDYARLVGLRMDDPGVPRPGHAVHGSAGPVGRVTSGTFSPSLRAGIALASVDSGVAAPGTPLRVEIRGTLHPATVVRTPFL